MSSLLSIKEITYGSVEYQLEIELRSRVLREPLGLQFTEKELAKDVQDIHLGAFQDSQLVGCVILSPLNQHQVKMRQVAVDFKVQGQGVGRKLVKAFEIKAQQLGFSEIHLNARETAISFYLRLGYIVYGEAFMEVKIPHRQMKKIFSI